MLKAVERLSKKERTRVSKEFSNMEIVADLDRTISVGGKHRGQSLAFKVNDRWESRDGEYKTTLCSEVELI